jgi:hypothetical protein
MAANQDRGEIDVHIGGQTRTLRFRAAECMLLEERLESDPLSYVAKGGGQTKFLVECIFCGLSREKGSKLTPMRVATWLDDADDLNRSDLQKQILYALARGKPGEEGKQMVKALDEAFGDIDGEQESDPLP